MGAVLLPGQRGGPGFASSRRVVVSPLPGWRGSEAYLQDPAVSGGEVAVSRQACYGCWLEWQGGRGMGSDSILFWGHGVKVSGRGFNIGMYLF